MKVRYSAQTDVGRRRSENQDSVLAYVSDDNAIFVFAVADGVGSLAAGADASQRVVDAIADSLRDYRGDAPGDQLIDGIRNANGLLHTESQTRGAMGSTLVAVVLEQGRFDVAHVGDSRAYLVRDGAVQRLTEDHSLVAEQVRAGILTEAQASESRHRHIITRSLGANTQIEVEYQPGMSLRSGDIFVLSSDGLHDVVSDAEIGATVANRDPKDCTSALIQLANARGGPDNISVVVAVVESSGNDE